MREREVRFRRWLIEQLQHTRWVTEPGDTVGSVADRLGVTPQLLAEAQRQYTERAREAGRTPLVLGGRRPVTSRVKITLAFPKSIWEDWLAVVAAQNATPAVLLRSLIQQLLCGPENPRDLGRGWRYRGRRAKLVGKHGAHYPFVVHTDISDGAYRALCMRAGEIGVTPTALMRGQVLELMEGRIRRILLVPSWQSMWDDPARYWTSVGAAG